MQLSPHFALDEFLRSQAAVRFGIDMTPPPAVVDALQALAVHILEPLRAQLARPIFISSGYRPPQVNQREGGAAHSQHLFGQAADIEVEGMTVRQVCQAIIDARLPFDQLIHEFGAWTHVSFNSAGPQRGEVLTAQRLINGQVEYHTGLPA